MKKTIQKIQKHFDHIAWIYDYTFIPIKHVRTLSVKLANLKPKTKLLDIGCGTGSLSKLFSEQGVNVTGIDISENMLKRAKQKDKENKIQFVQGDITKLPFEDQSFDAASLSFVIHELPKGLQIRALKETHRILKPGGKLIIAEYQAQSNPLLRLFGYAFLHIYESKYWRNFIRTDLKKSLRKHGFKQEKRIPLVIGFMTLIIATKTT